MSNRKLARVLSYKPHSSQFLNGIGVFLFVLVWGLMVPRVWGQTFPPQGIDTFPTGAPLNVSIGRCSVSGTPCLNNVADCPLGGGETCPLTVYSATGADLATSASRSNVIQEGSGADTGGTAVLPGVCTACAAAVSDANLSCWPAAPPNWEGNANSREVHTEMLSLNLCGACTAGGCAQLCYLAGQPAFNALSAVGAAGSYLNSFGEVERLTPGTDLNDFAATSFWDVKGVVKITPPPLGTSGVFVLTNTTDSILMVARAIVALPPPAGVTYQPEAGTKLPAGAGGACSVLPIAIRDPINNAAGKSAGSINSQVQHIILTVTPALSFWGMAALVVLMIGTMIYMLYRRRRLAESKA